jgi:hypothetical protein
MRKIPTVSSARANRRDSRGRLSAPRHVAAALALSVAFAALACASCTRPATPPAGASATAVPTAVAPASAQALLGEWRAADTAEKSGTLSDLTLTADGRFRYAGKNALGGPAAFGGSYQTGVQNGAPWIRLVYDDFPTNPTVWFYELDGAQLSVSAMQGNLTNGSALVFTRR